MFHIFSYSIYNVHHIIFNNFSPIFSHILKLCIFFNVYGSKEAVFWQKGVTGKTGVIELSR